MFGWFRKLTQRTAVEELIDSPPSQANDNAFAIDSAQQPLMPESGAFARPIQEPVFAPQQPHEENIVEVFTPEPMPEPPTFDLPDPHAVEEEFHLEDSDFVEPMGQDDTDADELTLPTESAAEAEAFAEPVEVAEVGETAVVAEAVSVTAGPVVVVSPLETEFDGLLAAPSPRPAMPLSAHPNFAGLGLAKWEPIAPRLLEPEAALTPEAQAELLKLFDDLFGPCGRYRLEWRTERHPGDDAMFAEIMTADLVRRVQNTIADVAELERPEPPKAVEAAFVDRDDDESEGFRQAS